MTCTMKSLYVDKWYNFYIKVLRYMKYIFNIYNYIFNMNVNFKLNS